MSRISSSLRLFVGSALMLGSMAALAASPFDGTWTTDLGNRELSQKPVIVNVSLANGVFICSSCVPPYTAITDGTDQPVAGHDFDAVAITMEAGAAIVRIKLHGKLLQTQKIAVSGDTMTRQSTDVTVLKPDVQTTLWTRTASGPPGSDPISGSWQLTKVDSMSGAGAAYTYSMSADSFTMSRNGQGYEAKFDGNQYQIAGDPRHDRVSVRKLGPTQIEEREYQAGKLVQIATLSVSADGKSMDIDTIEVATGHKDHYKRTKVS